MTNDSKAQDDADITELRSLIEEFNQCADLTVKLSNQVKLCKIFTITGSNQKIKSLIKQKMNQNLQNLDPEIKNFFIDCRIELENL